MSVVDKKRLYPSNHKIHVKAGHIICMSLPKGTEADAIFDRLESGDVTTIARAVAKTLAFGVSFTGSAVCV